jgi:DUF971 family protein
MPQWEGPERSTRAPEQLSVWKIAAGIVLGFAVWSLYERWQTQRQIEAFNAEVQRVLSPGAEARARTQRASEIERAARPLKPDERCISGQRFRRVENGWEQIGSC